VRQVVFVSAVVLAFATCGAHAQSDARAHSDADRYVLVQDLPCGRLEGTYVQNSDLMTTYFELAKIGSNNIVWSRESEDEIMSYCGSHPDEKLIHAIGFVFDRARVEGRVKITK